MIERQATSGDQTSGALYSECLSYRYGLWRRWGDGGEVLYIMLNPSTATELANDPTIERCQRRAVQLGFGAMRIANLFGRRATRPEDLRRAADPVGGDNDDVLRDWAARSDMILAAWGVHGAHKGRAQVVAGWLKGDVRHLGLTKQGHPRHPLYVSYKIAPTPWPLSQRYP